MSKKEMKVEDQTLEEEVEIQAVDQTDLENQEELDEDSLAMQTLKPGSRPVSGDPKSKIEAITSVIGAMHSMRKDDLTKWYKQAMDLIGKEASKLPGGASADHNASTIDMKGGSGPKTRDAMPKLDHKNNPLASISVREDVEEMFNGQDLSEEFKERASTLFEAAVHAKAITVIADLEEQYETRLEEEIQAIGEEMEKNLDTYLDYVVERWMEDNQVAIESSLRNELMEEFIDGMKNLFTEHYIDVPEEKIDVVESLAAKVEELEARLNDVLSENSEMREVMVDVEREAAIEEMAENLTMTQAEKFAALAEGIEFTGDVDAYKRKLSIVKENYFMKSTTAVDIDEETFEGETEDKRMLSSDPDVNRYAMAISRTVKK